MISSLQFGCCACIYSFEYVFESMIVCVSANASGICRCVCVCVCAQSLLFSRFLSFSYQSIEMFTIMNKLPLFVARDTLNIYMHTKAL